MSNLLDRARAFAAEAQAEITQLESEIAERQAKIKALNRIVRGFGEDSVKSQPKPKPKPKSKQLKPTRGSGFEGVSEKTLEEVWALIQENFEDEFSVPQLCKITPLSDVTVRKALRALRAREQVRFVGEGAFHTQMFARYPEPTDSDEQEVSLNGAH